MSDILIVVCALAGLILARVIFGPVIWFVDELRGANGRNSPLHIRIRRGPHQAAVFAQELWESNRALLRLIPGYSRRAEIFSHEVEVQAAAMVYGVEPAVYRYAEARRMGGYDFLKGLTPEEIEKRMSAKSSDAAKWVKRHRQKIFAARNR